MLNSIYSGNALDVLSKFQNECVDSVITSPPYYGLRHYDTEPVKWSDWEGELGREPTSVMFVEHLMEIFNQVKRVLKPTGTCFVVISDSYKDKSLMLVPELFAFNMIDRGWNLRNKIIWAKGNPMPSPVKDRFSNSWEYIYFFTKSTEPQYWVNERTLSVTGVKPLGTKGKAWVDWDWNPDNNGVLKKSSNWISYDYFFKTLYQPYAASTLKEFTEVYTGNAKKDYKGNGVQDSSDVKRRIVNKKFPIFGGNKGSNGDNATYSGKTWEMSLLGSKRRDVFNINTQPFPEAHFAVFSEKLVQPLIECGSPRKICNKCGLPQVEVYREFRVDTRPGNSITDGKSHTDADPNKSLHDSELSRKRQMIIHEPQAEIAECDCNAGFIKSVILDPFSGASTVAVVAEKMKRDWINIELNEEYIKIAKKRLAKLNTRS